MVLAVHKYAKKHIPFITYDKRAQGWSTCKLTRKEQKGSYIAKSARGNSVVSPFQAKQSHDFHFSLLKKLGGSMEYI